MWKEGNIDEAIEYLEEVHEEKPATNTYGTLGVLYLERAKANMQKAKTEFMVAYYMPDIEKFRNTAWGVLNGAADFIDHSSPQRNTSTYQERNFERIIYGHPILDALLKRVGANVQ